MARLWRNYTDLPDAWCRAVYTAVCPPGLASHDVAIKNMSGRGVRGMAYRKGSSYHANARPFVVVSVARTDRLARSITTGGGGYMAIALGNRREAVVTVLAHELRHLWQGKAIGKPRGMVYGAKGRMSERDADAYALQMLRRYRRGELIAAMALVLLCLFPSLAYAEPLKVSASAFIVSQAMDLHSTHRAIRSGAGVEGNPLMQGGVQRIVIKSAVSAGVIVLAHELNSRGTRTTARVLLYTVSALTAGIAARNYRIGRTP